MSNKNRQKQQPPPTTPPATVATPADVVMTALGAHGEAQVAPPSGGSNVISPDDARWGRRRRVEYRFLHVGQQTPVMIQDALNSAAQEGWRVVCAISSHLLLERELDREG